MQNVCGRVCGIIGSGGWTWSLVRRQDTKLLHVCVCVSLHVKMAAEGGSLSERVHELRQQLEDRSHQLQSVMKERHECQTALSKKDLDMCK